MKPSVIIASDSCCDLGPALIEGYGIRILPLGVTLGDRLYHDGVDITPEDIYAHYEKTGQLPKTSAANLGEFADFFEDLTANGAGVVLFTISGTMSSTYRNACLAAEDFENVHLVDARNLSTGIGLLVLRAAELAREGLQAGDIARHCRELTAKVSASFVVDDLEFLHKGGRCSAVAMLGANLLQLKPCITVRDGAMGVGKKYRGKFSAALKKYIADELGDGTGILPDHIFVTHAGCARDLIDQCVAQVLETIPGAQVHVTQAGCTISSHCGRNTLGVLFIRE